MAPTTPVPTKDLKELFIKEKFELPREQAPEQDTRESSLVVSDKSSGKFHSVLQRVDKILALINSQIFAIHSSKMAPTLRAGGYNGRTRNSQANSRPQRGVSCLSVNSDSAIMEKSGHKNSQTDHNNSKPSTNSTSQGAVRKTLLQAQGQQALAEGCQKQIQFQGHPSPLKILPGGLPGYGEASRLGDDFGQDQGLESHELDSQSLLCQVSKSPTSPCPLPPQLQHEQSQHQEPQKCQQKQGLEKLYLRRNDQDGQVPSRDLSTSRERQNSEAGSNATGCSRILIPSSSSHGSHVSLPEYPNPINPANEAFHHAFEINLQHMEDYTKTCAHVIVKKLKNSVLEFDKVAKSQIQFVEQQESTMSMIKKGLPRIAEKLAAVCEYLPKLEANISTQNSRQMSRIEQQLEEDSSQDQVIVEKIESLSNRFKQLEEDTLNKIQS